MLRALKPYHKLFTLETITVCELVCLLIYVLQMKVCRTKCMLGKHSTTDQCFQPNNFYENCFSSMHRGSKMFDPQYLNLLFSSALRSKGRSDWLFLKIEVNEVVSTFDSCWLLPMAYAGNCLPWHSVPTVCMSALELSNGVGPEQLSRVYDKERFLLNDADPYM